MNTNELYPAGSLVLSIRGEQDSDEHDNERHTGPRAWGWIDSMPDDDSYSVYFTNGTTVYITHEELQARAAYDVVTPEVMASRLNELQRYDLSMCITDCAPTGDDYNTACGIIGVAA